MTFLRHTLSILLATWIFLSAIDCLAIPSTTDSNATNIKPQNKSNAATMPGEIVLTLTTENETITLNLTRNTNIPSDVPVVVASNGVQTTWKRNSNQFAVYYEMNSSASILIEMKSKDGQLIKNCRGTLSINGDYYSVQPFDNKYGNHSSEEFLVDIDGVEHVMKVEDTYLDFAEYIDHNISYSKKMKHDNQTKMFDWPTGFQSYVVEMAIFVDFTLYNRWFDRSQAGDEDRKHNEAVQNIQYYFVQVANGVDMRYSSIRESDFSIEVRLTGIYVATHQSDSFWTESGYLKTFSGFTGYTEMYKALESFKQWLSSKIPQLGFSFDQATLFTGNRLYDSRDCSDVPLCSKSGLGDIKGICQLNSSSSEMSVSINKEFGIYSSIQTAAHELAHNLGADHDDYPYNVCSKKDQYIMAPTPSELSANNFNNAFKFSSCSIQYFRNYLAKITLKGQGNCLLVESSKTAIITPPNFATYPGQQYPPDRQCQDMYGSSSYYCAGGGSRDQTICQSMECWVPSKGACYVTAEQRAYDGTKCGNYKWCMNGQCVDGGSSPDTSDSCIYGDYKGQVQVLPEGQMSCYDMMRLRKHSCYLNRTAVDCCQTCAKIRDNSKPAGCEYGDKDPDHCLFAAKKKTYCYDADFADKCCDSCNTLKRGRVGCEYGDTVEGCTANNCYMTGTDCCETCQKLYDSKYPGCEFGDRADWCPEHAIGPQACARDAANCCRTCAPYMKKSPADQVCSDKAPWCSSTSVGQCNQYAVASTCCNTCSRYFRSK